MKVLVYSTPACPNCTQTKNLLMFSGIHYEEVQVERESELFAKLVSEGVKTFPVVDVEFEDGTTDRWTGYNVAKVKELASREVKSETVAA